MGRVSRPQNEPGFEKKSGIHTPLRIIVSKFVAVAAGQMCEVDPGVALRMLKNDS